MKRVLPVAAVMALVGMTSTAHAEEPRARDASWQTVTTITAVASMGMQVLMPRVFYADPETTVGWKARWHVGVLAPTMTLTVLTLLNEHALKDALKSHRPGCDDATHGTDGCRDYGSLSSHAFAGFAGLGHGTAVFLVDTLKWSDGRFNVAAFAGNVGAPLVFAVLTGVGRGAGNWESTGQVVTSSLAGLGVGALTGLTYALLARPECGYTGALICF